MVTGISLEEAVVQMTGPLSPLGTEILPLERALGRTLAADVAAPLDQPPTRCTPGTKPESPWATARQCGS